jgi:hypothetical protein
VWHAPEPHAAGAAGGQPRKRPRARCAPALKPAVCSGAGGGSTTALQQWAARACHNRGETPVSIPIPSPRFAAPFQHQVCRPRKDHDSGSTQWQMTHISKTTHQAENYKPALQHKVVCRSGLACKNVTAKHQMAGASPAVPSAALCGPTAQLHQSQRRGSRRLQSCKCRHQQTHLGMHLPATQAAGSH